MAKRKRKRTAAEEASLMMRGANHAEKVSAMGEGRRERAQTFVDRRRKADRKACRGKFSLSD